MTAAKGRSSHCRPGSHVSPPARALRLEKHFSRPLRLRAQRIWPRKSATLGIVCLLIRACHSRWVEQTSNRGSGLNEGFRSLVSSCRPDSSAQTPPPGCPLFVRSKLVSVFVSFFASNFVHRWPAFFPDKKLEYLPAFDGRAVCYPTAAILRDYLAWRQVDCKWGPPPKACSKQSFKLKKDFYLI